MGKWQSHLVFKKKIENSNLGARRSEVQACPQAHCEFKAQSYSLDYKIAHKSNKLFIVCLLLLFFPRPSSLEQNTAFLFHTRCLQTANHFLKVLNKRKHWILCRQGCFPPGKGPLCNGILVYALSSLLPSPVITQQIKRSPRLSLLSSCQPMVDTREPERTRWSSVELH